MGFHAVGESVVAGSEPDVTQLLLDWGSGDEESLHMLLPLVYEELKKLARGHMKKERSGHTLQTTAVVHEAYLKMVDIDRAGWLSRAHFFAAASKMMRRLLIDHARLYRAAKRGSGERKLPLAESIVMAEPQAEELLALDEALEDLGRLDPRQVEIVEMRHFGGLSVEETARAIGVSASTVKREWRLARLWLHTRLRS